MAGVLGWRACSHSSNGLLAYLSRFSQAINKACTGERCLSGASASTSAILPAWQRAASPRRHTSSSATGAGAARTESCALRPPACAACIASLASHPSALTVSAALRGFSAAAAAPAVAAAAIDPARTGGSSGASAAAAASSSSSSRFQAPWPWVDPSRPQVLPVGVSKKQRQPVPLSEALTQLLGSLSPGQRSKQSLEAFIRFRLDPRRSDHLVRGSVVLPYGTGKDIRLVVFAKGADAEIARAEGVELIGDEELISAIVASEGAAIAFDRLIATPEFMKPLARAGKVLGPKGLMPNPKMGTLTSDVAGAIRDIRRGRLDYRLSREAAVWAVLGRGSMTLEQLAANVGALVGSLWENRPRAVAVAGAGPAAGGGGGGSGSGSGAAAVGGGGGGGGAGGGAAGGGPAAQAAVAAPSVAGLERYFMTFLLKTNHSPSVHITYESLVEAAATRSRQPPAAAAGAAGATPQSKS